MNTINTLKVEIFAEPTLTEGGKEESVGCGAEVKRVLQCMGVV